MGPYEVVTSFDNGLEVSFVVNGHRLRLYHQPTSKQDFIQNVLQQREMELVQGKLFLLLLILKKKYEIEGVSPLPSCRFYTLAHDHGVHDFFSKSFIHEAVQSAH